MLMVWALAAALAGQTESQPVPRVEPRTWFQGDETVDWPHRWSGRAVVGFRVAVGADGRVSTCRIEKSSGHYGLDRATCRALLRRGRFDPARTHSGEPTVGFWTGEIGWSEPALPVVEHR